MMERRVKALRYLVNRVRRNEVGIVIWCNMCKTPWAVCTCRSGGGVEELSIEDFVRRLEDGDDGI